MHAYALHDMLDPVAAARAPTPTVPRPSDTWWRVAIAPLGGRSDPLSAADRTRYEAALGSDLSRVRVHTGPDAERSADAVDALAYAVGSHVVLGAEARPGTPERELLLAHELAHVAGSTEEPEAQGRGALAAIGVGSRGARPGGRRDAIHRFEKSERGRIAPLAAVIATAKAMAEKSMVRSLWVTGIDWPTFVKQAGGFDVVDYAAGKVGVKPSVVPGLPNRYTFTCQCGLIDMRHFYQLMYISMVRSNPKATQMGREHELTSEATSRFAPEDTPSNALGAFFGRQLPFTMQADEFATQLEAYLDHCGPVDFTAMSAAEQDVIVNYYGERKPDLTPANPNETAVPAILGVVACSGASRVYPFIVESADTETITDTEHLKSDSDIRDWIGAHDAATISRIPTSEKLRLINRLLDGWVSDDDVAAVKKILANLADADKAAVLALIERRVNELSSAGQRSELRAALTHI